MRRVLSTHKNMFILWHYQKILEHIPTHPHTHTSPQAVYYSTLLANSEEQTEQVLQAAVFLGEFHKVGLGL